MTEENKDAPSGRAKALIGFLTSEKATPAALIAAVVVLWPVLNWIYGELGSLRDLIHKSNIEIAETRATVRALVKNVERSDDKLDRVLVIVTGKRSDQ